ncbi:AMP-binding protein [Aquisalimonas sp. APHAB1-3]|uniref:AMP-binding protein n=1 Tax=Aquisalimonas sp. APHAB1-3 TaxID=3402080 RepID=UPI003AAC25C4
MSTNQDQAAVSMDPRIVPKERCVTRYLLDHHALERPDQVFAVFDDETRWTYAEVHEKTRAFAAGLAALGVRQGDHVAFWLPNGKEGLIAFFAINYLGAVFVPFNTAYKGRLLEHVIENSDAEVLITQDSLLERLGDVSLAGLRRAVLVGDGGQAAPGGLECHRFEQLMETSAEVPELEAPIEPWHTQSIIYTSGTTGPSKGVLSSYLHLFTNAGPETWHFVTGEDRFLVNMPMFHIGGVGLPFVMLARGGSIAMMGPFSTDTFWPFVRRTECTVVFLLGAMATFLLKREPDEEERNHHVRLAFLVPLTSNHREVAERFGIDIYSIFNMTEISTPILTGANPQKPGTCGQVRDGVDVRLVDQNDCEVPRGAVGEMILRTERPWAMNHGYYKNPEATAASWRNGWFHTGDAFRQDEDGHFYFVDRVKDAIRRRGENISSFEVEAEVIAHPAVQEAAAIGVASEYSENEVLVAVAPVPGQTVDPEELLLFLRERMPHFMVPRYIRVLDELPKTPTAKVKKHLLREEAVTDDCWDREVAGIQVRREVL